MPHPLITDAHEDAPRYVKASMLRDGASFGLLTQIMKRSFSTLDRYSIVEAQIDESQARALGTDDNP